MIAVKLAAVQITLTRSELDVGYLPLMVLQPPWMWGLIYGALVKREWVIAWQYGNDGMNQSDHPGAQEGTFSYY